MTMREGYHRLRGAWRPSDAQRRVLDELAAGRTNAEIAVRLGLSPETVKTHIARMLAETGCVDRGVLVQWWHGELQRRPRVLPILGWLGRAAATLAALALGALLLVAGIAAVARVASSLAPERTLVTADLPLDYPPTPFPTPVSTPTPAPGIPFPVTFLWAVDGGPGPDELAGVRALAVDAAGNAYVQDAYNHRIVKFDASGQVVTRWGSEGAGPGQFEFVYPSGAVSAFAYPGGIAVAPDGTVHVIDGAGRVQRFDPDGRYLGAWGTKGRGPGEFQLPNDLAIDAAGRVYVADLLLDRVQVFDQDGTLLAGWGSKGSGPGEFDRPSAVTVGPDGTVYVADGFNHRVQRFDTAGHYLGEIGGRGRDPGQFEVVGGVAVDSSGMVYVTDSLGGHRVQVFDPTGRYVGEWGSEGNAPGAFYRPAEIAFDGQGHVYVSEIRNSRIQKFRLP